MKVIFLDIDGVLNGYGLFTEVIYKVGDTLHIKKFIHDHYDVFGIHKFKVKRLAKIVHKTNAKIVISSSWRKGFLKPPEKQSYLLRKLLWYFDKYHIEVIGVTETADYGTYTSHRGKEIKDWLDKNPTVESFIILDDEAATIEDFFSREFIQTSQCSPLTGNWRDRSGLKSRHVRRAIKLLNKRV